jgi:hypothetical protein
VRAARSLVPPGALGTMNITDRLGFHPPGAFAATAIPAASSAAIIMHPHTQYFVFLKNIPIDLAS